VIKIKKRLTQSEEFEILKLVLDKFLWLGFGVMAYGLYILVNGQPILNGLFILFGGALLLILFMFLLIREYEVVK
jgi:hypothetical protein